MNRIIALQAGIIIGLATAGMATAQPAPADNGSTPALAAIPADGRSLYTNNWEGAPVEAGSAVSPVLSDGRFNSMLGIGAITAYSFKSGNRTLIISGTIATALAYKKWSRKRTRQRANGTVTPEILAAEDAEYEYRKGRGETAAALALLPAYGIAHGNSTYTVFGGLAALLAYGRYRETRRESARHRAENSTPTPPSPDAPQP